MRRGGGGWGGWEDIYNSGFNFFGNCLSTFSLWLSIYHQNATPPSVMVIFNIENNYSLLRSFQLHLNMTTLSTIGGNLTFTSKWRNLSWLVTGEDKIHCGGKGGGWLLGEWWGDKIYKIYTSLYRSCHLCIYKIQIQIQNIHQLGQELPPVPWYHLGVYWACT